MTERPPWILVVDDDEEIRTAIDVVLNAFGYRSVGAFDGQDALERLDSAGAPSLILLDLMMPRLDGFAFVRQLRSRPGLSAVPIVILSGHVRANDAAAELGASGCLTKPVELDDLLATVERFVKP